MRQEQLELDLLCCKLLAADGDFGCADMLCRDAHRERIGAGRGLQIEHLLRKRKRRFAAERMFHPGSLSLLVDSIQADITVRLVGEICAVGAVEPHPSTGEVSKVFLVSLCLGGKNSSLGTTPLSRASGTRVRATDV